MNNDFNLLDKRLVDIIAKFGYDKPTEIQRLAIPEIIFKKNHLILVSPTGSGKTEACIFPILSFILQNKVNKGIFAIYVTPLKALNRDIFRRIEKICKELNITIKIRHGDTPESERREILKNPPLILIITPETLDALLVISSFNSHLKNLNFLIIDEIHELIEGKRGANLVTLISRIKLFNNKFRIIALSATLGNPYEVAKFLFNNEDYTILFAEKDRNYEVEIECLQSFEIFPQKLKNALSNYRSAILFTNTRSTAELLGYKLGENEKIGVHHGSLSREEREKIESELREGKLKCVVATSSLEHGLDIPYVDIVFQFDSPVQATILKQRLGRSRHRINENAKGIIYTFNILDALESYVLSLNSNNNILEDLELEYLPFDILIHHIIGILLIKNNINKNELFENIKQLYLFKDLTIEDFNKILEHCSNIKLIFIKDDIIYPIKSKCLKYYFDTTSTIIEEQLYSCVNSVTRKLVGKVDGFFIYEAYENNVGIVLSGKAWKVISINEDKKLAELLPITEAYEFPIWNGEMLPVAEHVASEVFSTIARLIKKEIKHEESCKSVMKDQSSYPFIDSTVRFSKDAINVLEEFIHEVITSLPYKVGKDLFVIEKVNDFAFIINPKGTKVNKALAIFLRGLIGEKVLSSYYNAYGIALYLRKNVTVEEILDKLFLIPKIINDQDFLRIIFYNDYKFLMNLKQNFLFFGLIKKESLNEVNKKILQSFKNSFAEEFSIRWYLFNYLKINKVLELIEKIKTKKIKLLTFELRNFSPISRLFVKSLPYVSEVIKETSMKDMYEAIEKRLLEEELFFLCIACKNSFIRKVANLSEKIVCYKCGSIKVAALNPYDEEIMEAVKAFKTSDKKMLKKLSNAFSRIILSSELVSHYGKWAAFVMAAKGIGPEFARRILTNWNGDKILLLKTIMDYEINFLRTRVYWNT
jgi:ATP-dependent Lhr-like helicase